MTLLDQITDVADALTEPHMNREPIAYWDHNRHRKTRHHVTVQPGLLGQLYQSVIPSSSSSEAPAGGVPGSRPPLAVEALSRHDEIAMAVLAWCATLDVQPRVGVESNVRALVGEAAGLGQDLQRALLTDLRRWRGWCNVYLGWEKVELIRGVRCPLPACAGLGTLRVNFTSATALCRECGATWGQRDGSINLLAEHIKGSPRRVAV